MRSFNIALGALWFALIFCLSYGLSSSTRSRPRIVQYQPSAVPLPSPPAPAEFTYPPTRPAPVASLERVAEKPVRHSADPAPTLPRNLPPATELLSEPESVPPVRAVAPVPKAAVPEPGPQLSPEGCLVCGARPDSWIEVDGVRQGYCRRHYSPPVQAVRPPVAQPVPTAIPPPDPAGAPAPEVAASTGPPAPAAPGNGKAAQCRGLTRSGTQCRRKTTDPGGFCYQHRGQS